jgi:lipopolysaccharide export system protein LptA
VIRARASLAPAVLLALALPAAAWAQGIPGQDKSKPIEIIADTLTVDQDKDIALFTGDVEAVQGDMTMTSDLLRVFYSQAADAAAPAGGTDQSIRRIEAEGNVHLASPNDTAEGDRGVYDVPEAKVRLDGNVILTRGDSVVKGDSLEMDLNTNISTVRGKPDAGGRREQRVRALFVPEKKKEP